MVTARHDGLREQAVFGLVLHNRVLRVGRDHFGKPLDPCLAEHVGADCTATTYMLFVMTVFGCPLVLQMLWRQACPGIVKT